eukprot:5543760-Pyramimonas_sp.AAC.1
MGSTAITGKMRSPGFKASPRMCVAPSSHALMGSTPKGSRSSSGIAMAWKATLMSAPPSTSGGPASSW